MIMYKIALFIFVVIGISLFAYKSYEEVGRAKDIQFENVEALAQAEDSQCAYLRVDEDCEYKFKGEVGSTMNVKLGGVTIAKLKVNASGYCSYVYSKGSTRCSSGGNEMCSARYCPSLLCEKQ